MKRKIFFLAVVYCFSCNTKPNVTLPESEMYFRFRHVKEVYSKEDSGRTVSFELLDMPITSQEKDSLVVILNELGWQYKVAEDNEVLISKVSIGNLYNLSVLDDKLKGRIGKGF